MVELKGFKLNTFAEKYGRFVLVSIDCKLNLQKSSLVIDNQP